MDAVSSGRVWNLAARMMWYSVSWWVSAEMSAENPKASEVTARVRRDVDAPLGLRASRVMRHTVWM